MKTVSKLFTAAAIAFAAVACQVIDEGQIVTRQLEVTATIAEDEASKVDYDVVNDDEKKIYTISPTWHLGETPDQIIGFDNLGNTFTFTVSGVSGYGKIATFRCSYVPPRYNWGLCDEKDARLGSGITKAGLVMALSDDL